LNIFLIIPAYNEASAIAQVLQNLIPLGYSIILVDDGSSDDTSGIAATFPIYTIRHPVNLGQGAALETGMEAARHLSADFVVHFDADGQHDSREISVLLEPLLAGESDIVFGSRFLGNKHPGLGLIKKRILLGGRWINYWMTGILLTDAHNGFRAMNRVALNKIHFTQPGMAHATEILTSVRKYSLRYCERPVHILYTAYSKKKGQRISNVVNIMFHLIFKKN